MSGDATVLYTRNSLNHDAVIGYLACYSYPIAITNAQTVRCAGPQGCSG
jgi:hypothetical protein